MIETKAAEEALAQKPKRPEHQNVYESIRAMILFGEFAPGDALTIHGLRNLTGAGMTPVREALRRLTAEGAAQMQENRRICVPRFSPAVIEELFFMRKMLEPELARRAAQNISDKDIKALGSIEVQVRSLAESNDVGGFVRQNYAFYKRLYDCAGASVIAETVDKLWLRLGPTLRDDAARSGVGELGRRHSELIAALTERDVFGVASAVGDQVLRGLMQYRMFADSIDD